MDAKGYQALPSGIGPRCQDQHSALAKVRPEVHITLLARKSAFPAIPAPKNKKTLKKYILPGPIGIFRNGQRVVVVAEALLHGFPGNLAGSPCRVFCKGCLESAYCY